jgi:predicted GIY-YIG superfamily endonuclease
MTDCGWVFYIIENAGRTYAGVSPTPERRLRQHNGEIKGGAKYTTSSGPGWVHRCIVKGFQTKIQAMQFEWAVKHEAPRNVGGLESRMKKLAKVLTKEKWTSNSPLSSSVDLEVCASCEFLANFEFPSTIKYSDTPAFAS